MQAEQARLEQERIEKEAEDFRLAKEARRKAIAEKILAERNAPKTSGEKVVRAKASLKPLRKPKSLSASKDSSSDN